MRSLFISLSFILLSWIVTPGASSQISSSSTSISVSAVIPAKVLGEEFELLYEDRYFYIDNHGLTRLIVYLNGYQFKLTVDPEEVRQGANTYLIPLRGVITIDIFPLLNPLRNLMHIDGKGPPGAEATIIIADQIIAPGSRIHYLLNVVALPWNIDLSQNYPNPFNSTTNIAYEVPQSFVDGVNVQLAIYNLLGQKVRTLVEGRNFPGSFAVQWNGVDDRGSALASGVYLYRLVVDGESQTKRLVLMK